MLKREKFWMVKRVKGESSLFSGFPSKYEHRTARSADAEAERLARTNPGESFAVMEATKVFYCEPVKPVIPALIISSVVDRSPEQEAKADTEGMRHSSGCPAGVVSGGMCWGMPYCAFDVSKAEENGRSPWMDNCGHYLGIALQSPRLDR